MESKDLPGCFSEGDSLGEAMENFKEAVFEYFDAPKKYANLNRLAYRITSLTKQRVIIKKNGWGSWPFP